MKLIAALALFLSAGAAFAEANYPEAWGGLYLGEGKKCLSLSGTYAYVGEDASQVQMFPPSLTASAFSRLPVRGNATAVRIVHDPEKGKLTATVLGRNLQGAPTFTVNVGCKDGWVTYEEEKQEIVDGNLSEVKSVRFLAQSGDGALVVNQVYRVVRPYFFSLFKEVRQSNSWYRFKEAEE